MVPVGIWAGPAAVAPGAAFLPVARDFAADALQATASGRPLLLLFSQDGCPWCERSRREFLLPMQANAGYRERVIFRQIDIDQATPLTGFDGAATTHRAFARAMKVKRFPTVMLLGHDGRILAEPLVGFGIADFYGAYLDERIDKAVAGLARNGEAPAHAR
jgi:thiol-disulfide isomerase/thioredoxin